MGCGIKNHDGSKRTSPIKPGDKLVYNLVVKSLVLEDEQGRQLKWNGSIDPYPLDFIILPEDFVQLVKILATLHNLKFQTINQGDGLFQATFQKNNKTRLT